MKTERCNIEHVWFYYQTETKKVLWHGLFNYHNVDVGYFYQYNKKGFNLRNDL